MGYRYLESPIGDIQSELGLLELRSRREVADICFLHKLLTGVIDCHELLERIEFRTPSFTRSHDLFYKRSYSCNYLQHAAIPRLMRLGNWAASQLDFFDGISPGAFRRRLVHIMESLIMPR